MEVEVPQIIRLQLRKPKSWNWQLSTSKSSPHISLPIIQLYDYKGNLLVETSDTANILRKSWTSSTVDTPPEKQRDKRKVKRSRSEVLISSEVCNIAEKNVHNSPTHKSTRSDDMFRRKLKFNEESLKRAEEDGYRKFINLSILENGVVENNDKHISRKLLNSVNGHLKNGFSNIETFNVNAKKYFTRTSSAGTLIICEENFDFPRYRRRKKSVDSTKKSFDKTLCNLGEVSRPVKPTSRQDYAGVSQNDKLKGYSEKRKSSRKKVKECTRIKNESGHLLREHSLTKQIGANQNNSDNIQDGGDLLRLVRTLSDCDAQRQMGANVSRHSAKGLGRRSHSSGSICKGSARHGDGGKMCGSLPSYLDEDASTCNNNHECQGAKGDMDEVDRIPPLGDAGPGLHWKFSETSQGPCLPDQGYGSERSPEEEYPPCLPGEHHIMQCHRHLDPHACYPFITPESTFVVKLTKGSRGLGLSVTGGIECGGSWPGLIRIKRLFPHQPASSCGLLNVGDLLLEANGVALTGLTNYEALEVLRTASNQVELKVCRPPPDVLNCVSPISEIPPPPPRREPPNNLALPSAMYSTPEDDYYHGEYEITLKKVHGSLGFTLRKEDDSALGHYVRALVREPALTDGRIKAGDKIIAVNDVEICHLSHEQAVQYLRQCPEIVKLRLYRDSAQTPVATLSPTETTPRTSFSRKAHLRQEAVDMLNDLAAGRLASGANPEFYINSLSSPGDSPRSPHRQNCSSDASQNTDYEQFHEGLLQKCSHPFDEDAFNSLFSIESDDRPSRPSSLELYNPNQTPVATRKPRFNFSLAHNAYELNNLDPEVLDAPNLTYNLGNEEEKIVKQDGQEPMSMPHMSANNHVFSYKNPAYQSAHPQIGSESNETTSDTQNNKQPEKIKKSESQKENQNPIKIDKPPVGESYEVLAIELNRGWNSRLGFSLQGAAGVTYVSAVHADSVAARDGRLKPGDRLIKVNDESIEHMTTNEIIDLLRIVRGPVCIVVSRVKSNEDCPKSNAAEN